jgi:hypothetical protein
MQRRKFILFLGSLVTLLAICAMGTPALAQAGSTGGSISKQDKSVSGGEEPSETRRVPRKKKSTSAVSPPSAHTSKASDQLAGRWQWNIKCPTKSFTGLMDLVQNGSTFTGNFGHTNIWDNGTISNGQFHGNKVTFDREYFGLDHVRLTYSRSARGAVMQGPHYNAGWGQCSIFARKND